VTPFPFLAPDSTKPPSVLCRPFPLPWKKTHHFFPAFSFLRVSCLVQNSQQRLTTTLEPSLRRTKSTNKEKSPPSLFREQKLFFFFCIFFPCYSSPSFCLHKRKKERKKERKKRKKKISFRLFLSRLLILSTPLFLFVSLSLSTAERKRRKNAKKRAKKERQKKKKTKERKERKERKSTATSETQIKRKKNRTTFFSSTKKLVRDN